MRETLYFHLKGETYFHKFFHTNEFTQGSKYQIAVYIYGVKKLANTVMENTHSILVAYDIFIILKMNVFNIGTLNTSHA